MPDLIERIGHALWILVSTAAGLIVSVLVLLVIVRIVQYMRGRMRR